MMKSVVTGLLAAAVGAIVPGAASAQDRSVGDAMRARMQTRVEAQQQQSGAQPRDQGPRGDWRRGPDRPQPGADNGGWQRADAGRDGRGWRPDGRPSQQPWSGDRNGRDDDRPRGDRGGNGGWNQPGRADDGPGRGDRSWNGGGWNQPGRFEDGRGRGGDRGWNGGGWNQPGRYNGDRNGGVWNRDWRRESRYDWNRYRLGNRAAFHLPRYYAPHGWGQGYRRFSIGYRLSPPLFARNYWIADPWAYRLPDVYGPYQWVRYYDDALLVDTYGGEVVDVIHGIFW